MRQPRLSSAEMAEARSFERAGLCSISQAVKAFERGEADRIAAWRAQLRGGQQRQQQPVDYLPS